MSRSTITRAVRGTRVFDVARVARIAAFLALLPICAGVYAQGRQTISGDVTGDLSAGDYLASSTVTVPEGRSLTIPAGTVIYFDQYTGLDVRGELSVLGSPDSPVVLTSVNDTAGSPEPSQAFDWNGITAEGAGAALLLRHARVNNSVYGVNVTDRSVRAEFEGVVFGNNGYAPLVMEDNVVTTVSGEPFTASWNADPQAPQVSDAPADVNTASGGGKGGGGNRVRLILNVSAVGAAAAGVVVTGVSIARLDGNFRRYVSEPNDRHKAAVWNNVTTGAAGAVLAGIAIACVGVTLAF